MGTAALVVIDMLNPYEHTEAGLLAESVAGIIEPLKKLIAEGLARDDVRLIYANDNYGDFAATRQDLLTRALSGARPDLVRPIIPPQGCDLLMKVRHSAFFGTALDYLLHQDGIEEVILTGQVTEQCILYTALDAYLRHFSITVPPDGVAHIDPALGAAALKMIERNMRGRIVGSAQCLEQRVDR
jgi:nicotinamidase-related amidase